MRSPAVLAAAVAAILLSPEAALAHGDDVAMRDLGSAWSAPPVVLASAAVALLLFGQAFVRLRRRGRRDHADWARAALFGAGVAIATLALVSPLDAIGEEYLLSAHMLQHVLIGDVAPALVMVALRGPLAFFLVPQPVLGRLARIAWLRAALRFLLRPKVSFTVWALVLAVWHLPSLYDYALTHQGVHDLEHASFMLAGTLVWTQLVDPARRRELTVGGRLALAAALFAAGQVLSDVLIFTFSPLYASYAAQDERLLGLSPLMDQRFAGLVMMLEQIVTLGLLVAFLFAAYDREREARATRDAVSLAPHP